MTPDERFLALIGQGHDLMDRERACLTGGHLGALGRLAEEKSALLAALEPAMARVRGTAPVRNAVAGLVAASRRNERLILAARQGLAAARRQIDSIIAASRGAVAYDRDGASITSRDDAAQRNCRA